MEKRTYTTEDFDKIGKIIVESSLDNLAAYLFGSHARGEAGPDSDIDVALIVPDEEHIFSPTCNRTVPEATADRALEIAGYNPGHKAGEVSVTSLSFSDFVDEGYQLARNIRKEGRLLLARERFYGKYTKATREDLWMLSARTVR